MIQTTLYLHVKHRLKVICWVSMQTDFAPSALHLCSQAVMSHGHTAPTLLCLLKERYQQAQCQWCPYDNILPLLKGNIWIYITKTLQQQSSVHEYSKVKNCDDWLFTYAFFFKFCFDLRPEFHILKKIDFSCTVRSSTWKQMQFFFWIRS